MKISEKGIQLIKKWESFVPNQYLCPAGLKTIGYGHVILDEEKFSDKISEKEAEELLRKDCEKFETAFKKYNLSVSQNQFDALISFMFNIGVNAFSNSTLLKKIKHKDYHSAAQEFLRWNKTTIKGKKTILKGLTSRRIDERNMFLEG